MELRILSTENLQAKLCSWLLWFFNVFSQYTLNLQMPVTWATYNFNSNSSSVMLAWRQQLCNFLLIWSHEFCTINLYVIRHTVFSLWAPGVTLWAPGVTLWAPGSVLTRVQKDQLLYNYFTLDSSGVLTFFVSFPKVFIIYAKAM